MLTSKLPPPPRNKKGWPWDDEQVSSSYRENFSWPKISIVTPSYNQGEYIEETIRSILQQNYPNLEYIVIDGGSTDNTLDIIKKYADRITYWVSEKDNGQSHAINKGINKCTGDIFNWLNSDDWYEKGSLHAIAVAFIENKPHVAYGRERWVFQHSKQKPIIRRGTTIAASLSHSIYEGHIDQPSTFWSLPILRTLTPVKEELNYLMDADLWTRYLLKFGQDQTYFLDQILVNFRFHDASKSTTMQQHFEKERWSIRYGLLSSVNPEEPLLSFINILRKPMLLSYEKCQPHYEKWCELSRIDLIRRFYETGDLLNFKKIYWYAVYKGNRFDKILIKYSYRFVLPGFLLKFLRRLKAKTNG